MNTNQTFLIISIFLLLISCDKSETDLKFEKSVAYEIIPALLDSVYLEEKLPPTISEAEFNANDSTKYHSFYTDQFEKSETIIKYQKNELLIALIDSAYGIDKTAEKLFIEYYKNDTISVETFKKNEPYSIDLNKLILNDKFKLKHRSKLPQGKEIWEKKAELGLSGIAWISRIKFDESKKFGVLKSGFAQSNLIFENYIVFISKRNNKWNIDAIHTH